MNSEVGGVPWPQGAWEFRISHRATSRGLQHQADSPSVSEALLSCIFPRSPHCHPLPATSGDSWNTSTYRRPLSAKSTMEMGGWVQSPLCAVGWDNAYHGLLFHYGEFSLCS